MGNMNPARLDAATAVGATLVALAAFALLSHILRLPDLLVAHFCGAAPGLTAVSNDEYIRFLHCQSATENRYWTIVNMAVGVSVGYATRSWLRREARRDTAKERELDAELARIRANIKHRHEVSQDSRS